MAVLIDPERQDVSQRYMSDLSNVREGLAVSKADVRAAVNALDDWVNANAAAVNAALPLPFRTVATQPQKARMLTLIVEKRYITGAG